MTRFLIRDHKFTRRCLQISSRGPINAIFGLFCYAPARGFMVDVSAEYYEARGSEKIRLRDKYKVRLCLRAALRSNRFDRFLTCLIVLFAVILTALSYFKPFADQYPFLVNLLVTLDFSIFATFCAEIILKLYCLLYTSPSPRD